MAAGWPAGRLLDDCRSDDFATFIANVISRHPGFASRRYEEFTGPPSAEITFVGRFEQLVDDLVRALTLAGEEFNEAAVRAHAPANRNDYVEHPATYDRALAEAVVEAECASVDAGTSTIRSQRGS